jgi:hypothetical protein
MRATVILVASFEMYHLPIGNPFIGQSQLGNKINRTDEALRRADPGGAEV